MLWIVWSSACPKADQPSSKAAICRSAVNIIKGLYPTQLSHSHKVFHLHNGTSPPPSPLCASPSVLGFPKPSGVDLKGCGEKRGKGSSVAQVLLYKWKSLHKWDDFVGYSPFCSDWFFIIIFTENKHRWLYFLCCLFHGLRNVLSNLMKAKM